MLNALQINKKIIPYPIFPAINRESFEDSGKVLVVSVFEIYHSIAAQLYQPTLMRWLSLLYVYK